jgi:TIR domain
MADVFISYKRERRAAAEHLAEVLRLHGYTVWFDYALIKGEDYDLQLDRELRSAKAVVVLWCSLAVESEWVSREAGLAAKQKTLVPALIEPCEMKLAHINSDYIELVNWDGAPRNHALDPLLDAVATKVGRAPAPNYAALRDYEATWRRFGSPSLAKFGLRSRIEETASTAVTVEPMAPLLITSGTAQIGENAKVSPFDGRVSDADGETVVDPRGLASESRDQGQPWNKIGAIGIVGLLVAVILYFFPMGSLLTFGRGGAPIIGNAIPKDNNNSGPLGTVAPLKKEPLIEANAHTEKTKEIVLAEAEVSRKAAYEATRKAIEVSARVAQEVEAKRRADEDAKRVALEVEAKRQTDEEAKRVALEVEAKRRADEEAKRVALETAAEVYAKLVRDLQQELQRVGCDPGKLDGVWGNGTKAALAKFSARAKIDLNNSEPSQYALDQLRKRKQTACTVDCDDGEKLVNGKCVEIPVASSASTSVATKSAKPLACSEWSRCMEPGQLGNSRVNRGTICGQRPSGC